MLGRRAGALLWLMWKSIHNIKTKSFVSNVILRKLGSLSDDCSDTSEPTDDECERREELQRSEEYGGRM